jgi:uncharacterized membrane protein HdeD (DUF308 family)
MSQTPIPSPFEALRAPNFGGAVDPWALYVAEGAALVALGVVAIAMPAISSLAIEMFVGWLLFVGGGFRITAIWRRRHSPGFWWSLVSATVAICLGLMLIFFPLSGMLSLTLALMIMFMVEGVMSILTALDFRKHAPNWGLLLISGLIDLVLAFMIYQSWPVSGLWFVGMLVGVYMIFTGLSLAFTAIAARAAFNAEHPESQIKNQSASPDFPKGAAPTA